MEIAWKNIEFSDKELIQGFYRQVNARNCEFTFANNYLWAPFYEYRFAVIDGLLVFLSDELPARKRGCEEDDRGSDGIF